MYTHRLFVVWTQHSVYVRIAIAHGKESVRTYMSVVVCSKVYASIQTHDVLRFLMVSSRYISLYYAFLDRTLYEMNIPRKHGFSLAI